jgi:DNA-directed RNA polymerase specialized sigma24 family protein
MDTTQPDGNVAAAHPSAGEQSTEDAERALLAQVSAGDRSAMVELYILYFARLAKFFRHLTARDDLTEELINDTMVEVWQLARTLPSLLRSWAWPILADRSASPKPG